MGFKGSGFCVQRFRVQVSRASPPSGGYPPVGSQIKAVLLKI